MIIRSAAAMIAIAAISGASAQTRAPEPGQPPAQTPAQDAAGDMIRVYDEFCLARYPDPQAVGAGVIAHHMAAATPEQSAQVLLGRQGSAWRLVTGKGTYLVATEIGQRSGCVVSGDVADDAGVRAIFDLVVTAFAAGHDFGPLDKPPLQRGSVNKQPAQIQIIGVPPGALGRQAFVNMATGDGPVMHVRLTREVAP